MKIQFPKDAIELPKVLQERYYNQFYKYILNLFIETGEEIHLIDDNSKGNTCFEVMVGDSLLLFDYSAHKVLFPVDLSKYKAYFKLQYTSKVRHTNVFPFTPVSFIDWDKYYNLREELLASYPNID